MSSGGWGRRGWRLKGSGKERKCSAFIQCGVNKTNTSLKTFPAHKRGRGKQWNIIEQSLVGIYFNWNQGYVYLFMVCFYKEVNRAKWASLVSRDRRAVHAVPRPYWSPMFECNNVVSVKDWKILATLRSWQLPDFYLKIKENLISFDKPFLNWNRNEASSLLH